MVSRTAPKTSIAEAILQEVSRLRALPAAATQAIQMLADPNVDIKRLGQVLQSDQVIASQILRHANSAYYGGRTPCATVAEGIVRIGINQLKSVLYAVAAGGPLMARLNGYRMKDGELFRHSFVVATTARRLAALINYPSPEEAYAAGLLHDIGKLLLDRHLQPCYPAMTADIKQGFTIIEVEERHLRTDHATIGGLIAERWAYPVALVNAIRYHHAPTLAGQPQLAALVNLTNILVLQSGVGLTPLGIPPLLAELPGLLRIPEDQLGRLAYILRPEIETASQHFEARLKADAPRSERSILRSRLG